MMRRKPKIDQWHMFCTLWGAIAREMAHATGHNPISYFFQKV